MTRCVLGDGGDQRESLGQGFRGRRLCRRGGSGDSGDSDSGRERFRGGCIRRRGRPEGRCRDLRAAERRALHGCPSRNASSSTTRGGATTRQPGQPERPGGPDRAGQPPRPSSPGSRPASAVAKSPRAAARKSPGRASSCPVRGLLDLREEGYGFLRTSGYLPSAKDVYISVSPGEALLAPARRCHRRRLPAGRAEREVPGAAAHRLGLRHDSRRGQGAASFRGPDTAVPRRADAPRAQGGPPQHHGADRRPDLADRQGPARA